jgi:broad specificity phosphatase PhoE
VERLILVRHGESDYSVDGRLNGDPAVAVGLTSTGERQARALARLLAPEPIDLCVTTPFPRTQATARLALAGRDRVPVEVVEALGDPRAGSFEGRLLDDYRAWAWTSPSQAECPGGGESRLAVVRRYARGFSELLARPERLILLVAHALPIAYVLRAVEGAPPAPRMDRPIAYAYPYSLGPEPLAASVRLLEEWCREPDW